MDYSLLAKRLRLPLGFLIGGAYLILARPTPITLAVGGVVALIGVLVRAWASGHIVKNDQLATTGPYAHTRNPLYFGSFLIGAGFALAVDWTLLLLVIAFWVLVYMPTMERERIYMRGRYPEQYAEWEQNVPGFVPRPTPWRRVEPSGSDQFSLDLYMKHGEWKAGLTYVLAMAWLAYRARSGL